MTQARISVVKVTTKWCPSCHELEEKVFSRRAVREFLDANFKVVSVDGETPEGEAIVARHHVVGYPTVLFLHPSGAEIDRYFTGPSDDPDLFLEFARGVLAERPPLAERVAEAEKAKGDLRAQLTLGEWHAMRGDEARATDLLGKVVAADPKNEKGRAAKAMLILGKYLYVRGKKKFDAGRQALERLRVEFPAAKEASEAVFPLAQAYLGLGDEDKAFAVLDAAIRERPDRAGPYNTYAWFSLRMVRQLNRGIEKAKEGLARAPKDDGLWDTLAELYSAVGRGPDAVKACERAIAIAPKSAYYKAQRERFRAGDLGMATPRKRP